MTIEQLRQCESDFVTANDIAEILHCDPQDLRCQARKDSSALGFGCVIVGDRIKFSRRGFLRLVDGGAAHDSL